MSQCFFVDAQHNELKNELLYHFAAVDEIFPGQASIFNKSIYVLAVIRVAPRKRSQFPGGPIAQKSKKCTKKVQNSHFARLLCNFDFQN